MNTSSALSMLDIERSAPPTQRAPRSFRVVPHTAPVTARDVPRKGPPRAPGLRPVRPKRASFPAEAPELLRDLELDASSLARNIVPLQECTRAGDWIDVATGKLIVEHCDVALGTVPQLTFERVWLSCSTYRGPLGLGWHHDFDVALAVGAESLALRMTGGRVIWLAAPARGSVAYDADERLTVRRDRYGFVVSDAAGTEHRFVAHRSRAAFVLGSRRRRDGQELRFGYDHRARLVHVTHRGGLELELEYDREDRIVELSGPDPQRARERVALARFAYDARGTLCQASDALGQARRYTYAGTLLGAFTDRNGCSMHFEWDGLKASARCVHVRVDTGTRSRRLEYQPGRTRVYDALGLATVYTHDGALVFRILDARGNAREIARGPSGRIEAEIDALGQRWQRVYDARGNLLECRAPDGAKWGFEYDANDRVQSAIDAMGGRWQFEHDLRGRLTRFIDPLGHSTCFQHPGRWLLGVTDANGHHTAFAYDDAGHLAAWIAPGGATTRYAYDGWGRLVRVTDPQGNSQVREYDVLGRLLRLHEADGSRREFSYDAEGNLMRWKDQQRDVQFAYHGPGRISARTEAAHTICFEYDAEDRLIAILDEAGHTFQLRRDALGRVVETIGFDGRSQRYARDALGRIIRIERGPDFSEYDYDALGRVVEVQHSDGAFEGYRYREDGALVSAWNECITWVFERDALGRVTGERHGEYAIDYAYDALGRLTELRSSFGLRQVFEREPEGAVRRTAELASGFESRVVRDALGHIVERSLPGGAHSAWRRDRLGRPCVYRLETAAGEVLQKVVYEWEAGPRLRRLTDPRRGTSEHHYDTRGNLAWVQAGDGRYELRMPDAVGDLFAREDRRDREYGQAGQLLQCSTRRGEVRYRYDAAGHRVERCAGDVVQRYAWSASGHLKGVTLADGDEVRFGYDPLGRRIWKKYRGQTTRWLWAGGRIVHEWVEGELPESPAPADAPRGDERIATVLLPPAGSREAALAAALEASATARGAKHAPITWLWDFESSAPLAKLTEAGTFAVVSDHADTPRWLLEDRGRVVWDAESTVTGELRLHEGERHACLARFAGMYEDLETGLYYGGSYYDPEAGVLLSPGPIAAPPSLRAYAFAPEVRSPGTDAVYPWLTEAAHGALSAPPSVSAPPIALPVAPPVAHPLWTAAPGAGGWPLPPLAAVGGASASASEVTPAVWVAYGLKASFNR